MSAAAYRPTSIVCVRCGRAKKVAPKGTIPRYCGWDCSQAAHRERLRKATVARLAQWTCDLCGTRVHVAHGCQRYCSKSCVTRAHTLRMRFGLDAADFRLMVERQGALCAICDAGPLAFSDLCVDHCHDTGAIRGLLCRTCNTGIGHLRDSPDLLRRALDYLEATTHG